MAQPKPRKAAVAKMPTEADLKPAPDNGVPYTGAAAKLKVRDYPQLSTRVPPELMARVERCVAESGVSLSHLVRRGLEHEVENRGY